METIINITNKKPTVIKNTKSMSYVTLSSIITIKDAEIYLVEHKYRGHQIWAFKTSDRNKTILNTMFGRHIYRLFIIDDGLFPTLIRLYKGCINYDTFVDLFKQKKLAIKEINAELREHDTSYHPRGGAIGNRVIKIYCESISD